MRITLMLLTYEPGGRRTAAPTLRAFLDRAYTSHELAVHIADDGSVEGHVEELREIAAGYDHIVSVGSTNAERGGYGKSYNLATQAVHPGSEIIIPCEDDWFLERDLDLDPLVATLMSLENDIECVRLGYLGFTQQLRGEVLHTPAGVMLQLDSLSLEPHVFAGHVRIETRDFEQAVGPWPEGIPAGNTEMEITKRTDARHGVAFPLDLIHPRGDLFSHTGALGLGELEPGK